MIETICILAGGKGRRLGAEKWLLTLKGRRLLDYAVDIAKQITKGLNVQIIVASGQNDIRLAGIESVRDLKGKGPIAGLYVSLLRSSSLIFPCDMPFLTSEFLYCLLEKSIACDITICRIKDKLQPQVGVYSNKCLPYIEDNIERNQLSLLELIKNRGLAINIIKEQEVKNYGAPERLFFNINTREDFAKAEEMVEWTTR